jgi:hypothetical protein
MAKVFRFHDGSNNIEDWQTSTAYGKNAIEAIQADHLQIKKSPPYLVPLQE